MSSRRGQGEGSIHRRQDGRWAAVIDLGWSDGKRRRKFFYGRTRREVADKLAAALRQQQEGRPFVGEVATVEKFLSLWLEAVRPSVRPATWRRYEQYVRLHIVRIWVACGLHGLDPSTSRRCTPAASPPDCHRRLWCTYTECSTARSARPPDGTLSHETS